MKHFFSFLLLSLLLNACAVNYRMQVNRFETPETKGEFFKGEVGVNDSLQQKVTVAEVDAFPALPLGATIDTTARLEKKFGPGFNLNLGLLSRLDAYLHSQYDAPTFYGIKFQFWGDPEAKASNGFKAALQGGLGSLTQDGGITVGNIITKQNENYDTHLEVSSYEGSLLLGQRFNKEFLLYTNFFYAQYKTSANLNQNGVLKYKIKKDANNMGALLGIKYGEKSHLKLESGFTQGNWGQLHQTLVPIGVAYVWAW